MWKVVFSYFCFWRLLDGGYGFSLEWRLNGVSTYLSYHDFFLGKLLITNILVRSNRGPALDDVLLSDFNGKFDED